MTDRASQARPATVFAMPTSVRTLLAPESPRGSLPGAMKKRPPRGIAGREMAGRYSLAGVTWRLLDSRVLGAAAEILDIDVTHPLVEWLSAYERVAAAARATLTEPSTAEKVEILAKGLVWRHDEELTVTVTVEQTFSATFDFRLDVTATLGETSVVVRAGAVREVVLDVLRIAAEVHLEGWPDPLWKPEPVELPKVQLVVQPPFLVPLPPIPTPRVPPPRATAVRPAGGA